VSLGIHVFLRWGAENIWNGNIPDELLLVLLGMGLRDVLCLVGELGVGGVVYCVLCDG
jgi:hypothetical protein